VVSEPRVPYEASDVKEPDIANAQMQLGDSAQGGAGVENTEALVNTVNCVGVMGRGLALQFKQAFPANFKAYETACRARAVVPGGMFTFDNGALIKPRYIINFPTKRHWRDGSRIEDIQSGLKALIDNVHRLGIRSIALPPLGCGLGGLNWRDVQPMIENSFSELPGVHVLLFQPSGTPDAKLEGGLNIGLVRPPR
jgi:O-acetyl-ADP-ribose deacetylase (regulator of RNase III)